MAADDEAPISVIPDVRFLRPAKGERRATYFEPHDGDDEPPQQPSTAD
jgi:hypothetical protein